MHKPYSFYKFEFSKRHIWVTCCFSWHIALEFIHSTTSRQKLHESVLNMP